MAVKRRPQRLKGTPFRERPNGTLLVVITLTLVPGRDDDLIDRLKEVPPHGLAATVRELMRNGVVRNNGNAFNDEPDLSSLGVDL